MDDFQLLVDLHEDGPRQGPGGESETRLAVALSGLKGRPGLRLADIGCGTGAATLVLARDLDAHVTAVDFLPEFLARLEDAARRAGVADRSPPWWPTWTPSPYKKAWRRYLRPGGILAVSELTWLTARRPEELQAHWEREYPEVGTASAKMAVLERHGFSPLGYFALPEHCWLDNYYRPLQRRFAGYLERQGNSAAARAIVAAEEREISLYERYKAFVGYGYYIGRKVEG